MIGELLETELSKICYLFKCLILISPGNFHMEKSLQEARVEAGRIFGSSIGVPLSTTAKV